MRLAELRQQHPQYNDMSDQEVVDAFHQKHYSDLPVQKVAESLGAVTGYRDGEPYIMDTSRKNMPEENPKGFIAKFQDSDFYKGLRPLLSMQITGGNAYYQGGNEVAHLDLADDGKAGVGGLLLDESLPAEAYKYATGKTDFDAEKKRIEYADKVVKNFEQAGDNQSEEYKGWVRFRDGMAEGRDTRVKAAEDMSWGDVWEGIQANPWQSTAAELVNATLADPYLILTPIGWSKGAAVGGVRAAKAGIKAGASLKAIQVAEAGGKVVGGATGAGLLGGAIVAPISVFEQLNENDTVAEARLWTDVKVGAGAGVLFAGVIEGAGAIASKVGKVKIAKFEAQFNTEKEVNGLPKAIEKLYERLGIKDEVVISEAVTKAAELQTVQAQQKLISQQQDLLDARAKDSPLRPQEEPAVKGDEPVVPKRDPKVEQSTAAKIMEGSDTPARTILNDMTPQEKAVLRERFPKAKNDIERIIQGKAKWKRQQGNMDVETTAFLAAFGLGAAAGYAGSEGSIGGAVMGGGAGLLAAATGRVGFKGAKAVRNIVKGAESFDIKKIGFNAVKEMDQVELEVKRVAHWIKKELTDDSITNPAARNSAYKKSAERVNRYLDGEKINLTAQEKAVAAQMRKMFDRLWVEANRHGVIGEFIRDYVPHLWERGAKNKEGLWAIFEDSGSGKSSGTKHGKHRTIPTIAEGIAKDLTPQTLDIAEVFALYATNVHRAIANKKLIAALKREKAPNGENIVMHADDAPQSYVHINHPEFSRANLRVHPEVEPSIKHLFDSTDPGVTQRALVGLNAVLKRWIVSGSMFHLNALIESGVYAGMAAGMGMSQENSLNNAAMLAYGRRAAPRSFRKLAAVDMGKTAAATGAGAAIGGAIAGPAGAVAGGLAGYLSKVFLDAGMMIAGKTKIGGTPWMKALFEGEAGDVSMFAVGRGLKLGVRAVEDMQTDALYASINAMNGALDAAFPKPIAAIPKTALAGWKNWNRFMDFAMWERFNTGAKLTVFAKEYEKAILRNVELYKKNPNKYKLRSEDDIGTDVAEYVNDAFGGLDWYRMSENTTNRIWRTMKLEANSPSGRRLQQILMFAPDWTVANIRILSKAFPFMALRGKQKFSSIRGGEGRYSALAPTLLSQMHRQYALRATLFYMTTANAMNYLMSGHSIFDNDFHDKGDDRSWDEKLEDMSFVDLGDNRKMVWSKQYTEFFHWGSKPFRQGMNKMGTVPRIPAEVLMNQKWLSPRGRAPAVYDEDAAFWEKAAQISKHLAGKPTPITLQQINEQRWAGLAGSVGHPIYGGDKDPIIGGEDNKEESRSTKSRERREKRREKKRKERRSSRN